MTGLSILVSAPWDRARYRARVAAVVTRYERLVGLSAPLGASKGRGRLELLLGHPGALSELERCPPEALSARLAAARAEHQALERGASLPAPPDDDARVRVLALADLTWLVLELRALRRLARGLKTPTTLAAGYAAQGRPDPLPAATPDLVAAAAALPGPEVRRRLLPLLALRHARADLAQVLLPPAAGQAPAPVRVGRAEEIPEGGAKRVEAFGRTVAVFRHRGRLFALDDACPHRGGPLGQGEIDPSGAVLCPLHAWAFDLETGAFRGDPGTRVCTYAVEEHGGLVRLIGRR